MEAPDAVPDRLGHPAHLAIPTLVQDELEAAPVEPPHAGGSGRAVLQLDPLGEPAQHVVRRLRPGLHLVHLLDAVARMREPVRERAVVREQERTRRLDVQTADRHDSRAVLDLVDDGGASLRVARGRDHAGGFVQQHVGEPLLRDGLAVDLDEVAAADERVQLTRARR